MAKKKAGIAAAIISIIAPVLPSEALKVKNKGAPIAAAAPKHTNCRFVKFIIRRVFTSVMSFGTDT